MADTSVASDTIIEEEVRTMNEKTLATSETTSAAPPTFHVKGEDDLDEAFKYLHDHTDAESAAVDLVALRRKIDWHIVPIMFACYTLQFVDKVVINASLHL